MLDYQLTQLLVNLLAISLTQLVDHLLALLVDSLAQLVDHQLALLVDLLTQLLVNLLAISLAQLVDHLLALLVVSVAQLLVRSVMIAAVTSRMLAQLLYHLLAENFHPKFHCIHQFISKFFLSLINRNVRSEFSSKFSLFFHQQ